MGARWREVQEGADICIPMADSCWCMAETNYPPIKKISFLNSSKHLGKNTS